jgi:hypothetical protein
MRRLLLIVCLCGLLSGLSGCKEEPPPEPAKKPGASRLVKPGSTKPGQ